MEERRTLQELSTQEAAAISETKELKAECNALPRLKEEAAKCNTEIDAIESYIDKEKKEFSELQEQMKTMSMRFPGVAHSSGTR